MTETELTAAIALAVPQKDAASASTIAKAVLNMALSKVGRMTGVSFNRDLMNFTFTANKASYKLGSEILQKYPTVWNMQELWFTDQEDHKVQIVALDEFNNHARGGTSTGRPTIGTIHSSTATLEVYPIPDSAYTACAYVKRQITQLADIPTAYHDVLYAKAIEFITAAADPNMAAKLSQEGVAEIQKDALTTWDGTLVEIDRPIVGTSMNDTGKTKATSYDLLGAR